jgi:hypothetical protein
MNRINIFSVGLLGYESQQSGRQLPTFGETCFFHLDMMTETDMVTRRMPTRIIITVRPNP